MTVRWKPLIVLTGLFLVVAAMSLLAFTFAMPGKTDEILPKARAAVAANQFTNAEILYRQALQIDEKNVATHEEMAELFETWAIVSPPQEQPERLRLHAKYVRVLTDAAKYGKSKPGPRRKLLLDALSRDDASDALPWADALIALVPEDPDANYVKAIEALDREPPSLLAAKSKVDLLVKTQPGNPRTCWAMARLALATKDDAALETALAPIRDSLPDSKITPSQRLARLRLRLVDLNRTNDPAIFAAGLRRYVDEAKALAAETEPSTFRIRALGACLEGAQERVKSVATRQPAAKAELTTLGNSLEDIAEKIYARALETSGATDLRAHLAYAEHLVFRGQSPKALEVADKALKLPIAAFPAWEATAASLREIAIKAALSNDKDADRFTKAEPYIKGLLACSNVRFAAMGHFFRGLVALERSGLTAAAEVNPGDDKVAPIDPKLRDQALEELKLSAAGLPDAATAQALYGVSLIMAGEQSLGRQYLQTAYRLGQGRKDGGLEPRYQVWAAWSILQAGYPEEAEPILAKLQEAVDRGDLPKELDSTLHLLRGEAFQAHNTKDSLKQARDEYLKSVGTGQPLSSALQIRLAQIDLRLEDTKAGMARIESLRKDPKTGPTAERLAVVALKESGQVAEAAKTLAAARVKYPDSDELAEFDATLRANAADAAGAEKVLADYVAKHPDRLTLALTRVRLLAGPLKRPDEARTILVALAEKSETSAPMVELANLDITRKDFDSAAKTIAQIRARWKEIAAADVLEAQLALASENPRAASVHLAAALAKDPNNKVVLLWKAILDERNGAKGKATQGLESILRDKPVKEIEEGLSLTRAAEWALADMALQNQNLDDAIKRFEILVQANPGGDLDRAARWKLVAARAGKGDSEKAKAEVAELLAAPKTTLEERVQAADFYRRQGDDPSCLTQLEKVLKEKPDHTGALAYKALALASRGKPEEAVAVLRKALGPKNEQPANMYLMLAAAENLAKPRDKSLNRALAALEEGLVKEPKRIELVQAKYQVMKLMRDPKATEFVETAVKNDPSREMRSVLAEAYRENLQFAKAEDVVRGLLKETPKDTRLSAALVGLVANRSAVAFEAGDTATAQKAETEALDLIRKYRAQFPGDLNFPQADWDLAMRRGDYAKARTLCDEISALDPGSPAGPILRARLHTREERPVEVAKAYEEALARTPGRIDIRLAYAQSIFALGKFDEVLTQTKLILDSEHDQPQAVLLKAKTLVQMDGKPEEKTARRTEAANLVKAAIVENPNLLEAYHLLAELRLLEGTRDKALNALREGLNINRDDDAGLSSLIYHLSEPINGQPPSEACMQEAKTLAESFAKRDDRGVFALAVAVGYQRAGRNDLARTWAEKAANKIDQPAVHLVYGSILLALAEQTPKLASSQEMFVKAVEQYDAVLKAVPFSIEAVNNKAWILHKYLRLNAEALRTAEPIVDKAKKGSLPAEFYDTLGSIQESMNLLLKAEESYDLGLRKSPDHATLNYHMGKLLSKDPKTAPKAIRYLEKAKTERAKLAPEMIEDLDGLMKTVQR
jgi:predicted Zn-dependent protease